MKPERDLIGIFHKCQGKYVPSTEIFLVVVRALAYLITLGADRIREAAGNAVLNANYLLQNCGRTIRRPTIQIVCMNLSSRWKR